MRKKLFLRPADLAAEVGVCSDYIRRLEKIGVITAQRDRNGHRRFPRSELEKLFRYLKLTDKGRSE